MKKRFLILAKPLLLVLLACKENAKIKRKHKWKVQLNLKPSRIPCPSFPN